MKLQMFVALLSLLTICFLFSACESNKISIEETKKKMSIEEVKKLILASLSVY
jgi:hypothetical protein